MPSKARPQIGALLYQNFNNHALTFVEHQCFPKGSCIFVHSLYVKSGSVSNVNGKMQFFCSFEIFSFTKHCKMLLMFENRFRNMTKEKIRNFMF